MNSRLIDFAGRTAFAVAALIIGCAVLVTTPLYAQVTDTTDTTGVMEGPMTDTSDLVQVLEEEGNFSQLIEALQRTGLDQALSQEPAFTLFAPTDSAFQQMETPISQMDEQQLSDVLRYHVAFEQLPSDQLAQLSEIQVGTGETVQVSAQQTGQQTGEVGDTTETGGMQQPAQQQISIAGANVVQPDIQAENGVIHGIDQVLTPPQVGAE